MDREFIFQVNGSDERMVRHSGILQVSRLFPPCNYQAMNLSKGFKKECKRKKVRDVLLHCCVDGRAPVYYYYYYYNLNNS